MLIFISTVINILHILLFLVLTHNTVLIVLERGKVKMNIFINKQTSYKNIMKNFYFEYGFHNFLKLFSFFYAFNIFSKIATQLYFSTIKVLFS